MTTAGVFQITNQVPFHSVDHGHNKMLELQNLTDILTSILIIEAYPQCENKTEISTVAKSLLQR